MRRRIKREFLPQLGLWENKEVFWGMQFPVRVWGTITSWGRRENVEKGKIDQQGIAILSPYNAQVSEIRKDLSEKKMGLAQVLEISIKS